MAEVDRFIRVVLVDDDPMVISGLRSILGHSADIEVVGTASNGEEALQQVALHFPDVVLMDIRMPGMGGIEATQRLVNGARAPKVVALTSFDTDDHLIGSLEAGAEGYLLKDIAPADLPIAIRKVMTGEPIFSPQSLRRLIAQTNENSARRSQNEAKNLTSMLTDKERDVAILVARDLTNRQIADTLFLGEATVKTHLNRITAKFDASSRVGIAVIVERSGIGESM